MLGIDFGTSNSAAAFVRPDGTLCPIELEAGRTTMPTALYFGADSAPVQYGSAALQAYLNATLDHEPGGRLMRAIKSLLGSRLMDERTAVNGQMVSFFDIVTLFFKELKRRAEDGATGPELHNLFSQCRFGFQQALASWPDNRVARDELHAATEYLVRYELAHGDLNTARVLLAELTEPPADLVKLLDEATARAAAEAERRKKLESLGKEHDASIGQRTRTWVGIVFSLGWGLMSLSRYLNPPNYDVLLYFSAAVVLVVVGVGWRLRKALFATRINATMYAAFVTTTVTQLILYPACAAMNVPFTAADSLPLLLYFFAAAQIAFVADRRMIYAAAAFLVAFLFAVI